MKNLLPLTLLFATACDPSKIKTAVADLELPRELKPQACELYKQRGKELAESIWLHDWPVFAPMWKTPPNAKADELFCRRVITGRGATFITKPPGSHSSTALFFVVALHPDFATWSDERRASTMCHEAAHIVWQHRRGKMAAIDYLTVSGRLVTEGTASALGDAADERNGVSAKTIADSQARRAERFPKAYKVSKTVDAQCVAGYFAAIRQTLRDRAGV